MNSKLTKNYHFNRFEQNGKHNYVSEFISDSVGDERYEGLIKCKLAHGENGTIILPEYVLLEEGKQFWIKPLFFNAPILRVENHVISCTIFLNISHGVLLEIYFQNDGLITTLSDGSEIFKCTIIGPEDLQKYSTGEARWDDPDNIELSLYHHTRNETITLIQNSGYFKGSKWNIQGNKELKNVEPVYFTALNKIVNDTDLHQIAMANKGKVPLLVDNGSLDNPEDILSIEVYRENSENRQSTLNVWVNIEYLLTDHIYFHKLKGQANYFQIVCPFIQSVGMKPDKTLKIVKDRVVLDPSDSMQFDYIVVGSADTFSGLEAPYDEENTDEILKIERCDGSNMLEFWIKNANQDHYSGKNPEMRTFDSN